MPLTFLSAWLGTENCFLKAPCPPHSVLVLPGSTASSTLGPHRQFHRSVPGLLPPTSASPGLGVVQGQGLGLPSLGNISAQFRLGTEQAPGQDWFQGDRGATDAFLGCYLGRKVLPGETTGPAMSQQWDLVKSWA